MTPGARTPEELDGLLEDAFVLRDRGAVTALFEARAVLVPRGSRGVVHGNEEIAAWASGLWSRELTYVAEPRRVVQAGDVALLLADRGTSVMRRGTDGSWRYAIALLATDRPSKEDS